MCYFRFVAFVSGEEYRNVQYLIGLLFLCLLFGRSYFILDDFLVLECFFSAQYFSQWAVDRGTTSRWTPEGTSTPSRIVRFRKYLHHTHMWAFRVPLAATFCDHYAWACVLSVVRMQFAHFYSSLTWAIVFFSHRFPNCSFQQRKHLQISITYSFKCRKWHTACEFRSYRLLLYVCVKYSNRSNGKMLYLLQRLSSTLFSFHLYPILVSSIVAHVGWKLVHEYADVYTYLHSSERNHLFA